MKKLFYPAESIENRISFYMLLCFLLTLPFDRFYSTITLICFLIHSLIYFRKERFRQVGKETFILQSVFWVSVLASLYAPSWNGASNTISKQLAIFLFPVLLAVSPLDLLKYRSKLLAGFAIGCTGTVLYLFADALHVIRFDNLPLSALLSHAFVNQNFSLPLDLHATYFSMMLGIALVFCFGQALTKATGARRLGYVIVVLIMAAGLAQLSSKSVFIALFIVVNGVIPWYLLESKKRVRYLLIAVPISVILVLLILTVPVFKERILIDLKKDLQKAPETENLSWRRGRWDVSMNLIRRSPIIGNGTGSEIPMLRELYFERKMYSAYLAPLNVHNQFLSFLINSGIIGLLVYLGTLLWGFWLALKRKDLMLLTFMLLILSVSFSEDILDVNKGIFIYAFFFSFLVLSGKKLTA